jgi:NADPH2:quinone reductase
MKAARFHSPGSPAQVLSLESIEQPRPAHGEVLVRMLQSPINPSDLMFVRGKYTIAARCPATPGFEGVGIVESSGGGLKGRLFQGKRVAVLNKRGGNWAEFVTVPASQVIPVSSQLTTEQAATFFVNPATAWVMTQEVLRVPRRAWLVQTAAGSALGRMIIRLGRLQGFKTLNIVRRAEVAEELRGLGADHVEVFDEQMDPQELVRRIQKVTGSDGVQLAIDAVGGTTGSAVIESLGLDGRMLAYGTLSNQPLNFSPRTLMTVGSRVEGFWLGNFMNKRGLLFKLSLVKKLTQLIGTGVLGSEVASSFSLDQIQDAVKSAEHASGTGKVLLQIASA